jgi:hypothetical protein
METPLQSARRKLRRARSKWANSAVDMAKARRAGERGASSLIYELQREARFRALQEEQLVRPPPTPPPRMLLRRQSSAPSALKPAYSPASKSRHMSTVAPSLQPAAGSRSGIV